MVRINAQYNSHYSRAQQPGPLMKWSLDAAQELVLMFSAGEYKDFYPVLVYTGMSGIATATALSLAIGDERLRFGMMYVRKEGEKSHGTGVETCNVETNLPIKFIFCDDFISNGDTCIRVFEKLMSRFNVLIEMEDVLCALSSKDSFIEPLPDTHEVLPSAKQKIANGMSAARLLCEQRLEEMRVAQEKLLEERARIAENAPKEMFFWSEVVEAMPRVEPMEEKPGLTFTKIRIRPTETLADESV